jgi:hypothetical protein
MSNLSDTNVIASPEKQGKAISIWKEEIATWRTSATRNDSMKWGERGSNPHSVSTDGF